MKPHLDLAHSYWRQILKPCDFAIDMTCGNGRDTEILLSLLPEGRLFALDLQEAALQKTLERCGDASRLQLFLQSHADPIPQPLPSPPRLIVYNLGYLPGGDKSVVTRAETTLKSLQSAAQMLGPGGALSVTCYPGHEEGLKEEEVVIGWAETLASTQWRVCLHRWVNRPRSPSLLIILKREDLVPFP